MSHRTTRAPTEAHSLPATVLTASAAVVAVLAAVATASAPVTAVTVAVTVVAVLAVQRGRKALATRRPVGRATPSGRLATRAESPDGAESGDPARPTSAVSRRSPRPQGARAFGWSEARSK